MGILAPLVYSSSSLGYHETFIAGKSNLSENLLMILFRKNVRVLQSLMHVALRMKRN